MINSPLVNISLVIFGVLTSILVIFPNLDIVISNIFYCKESASFCYKYQPIIRFFYVIISNITKLFLFLCFVYILYLLIKYNNIKIILKSSVIFLLISALIGPGIIVNSLLKNNFGRARPRNIVEFSGYKQFTPAFVVSDQCNKNCSFACGHASVGFYITIIAYIVNSRYFNRFYILGLLFGVLVGISRIVMWGHFASDVTSAAFIVLFLNHLIYLLWKNKISKCKKLQ